MIDRFEGFVFDLDGTVYLDDQLLPGTAGAITAVREGGRPLCYLTNKPLELPAAYAATLTRLGLPTEPSEVVSSLDALVRYLRREALAAKILCVSEPLVETLLSGAGFEVVDRPEQAEVVVVSFDRTFDYPKLHAAYRAVRNGARIVATNPDRFCPTADGGLPDCAAMLAAIEACTGSVAEAIVGKPSAHMAATLLDRIGVASDRTLLVGDRLATDIAMANRSGMASALVLTGDADVADIESSQYRPDFVLADLGGLLESSP